MLTGQLRIEALVRKYVPGWDYADDFPKKPPGIWRRTWKRLRETVSRWEAKRDEVFFRRIAPLLSRTLREPR